MELPLLLPLVLRCHPVITADAAAIAVFPAVAAAARAIDDAARGVAVANDILDTGAGRPSASIAEDPRLPLAGDGGGADFATAAGT